MSALTGDRLKFSRAQSRVARFQIRRYQRAYRSRRYTMNSSVKRPPHDLRSPRS